MICYKKKMSNNSMKNLKKNMSTISTTSLLYKKNAPELPEREITRGMDGQHPNI